jgi:transcription elongation factor
VSGEQSGLTGRVVNITGEICQLCSDSSANRNIDVPLSNIRVHICVGDYVRVKAGTFVGSVGWVMQVEQGPDTDIVTFMDETLIKKGEAQDVSIFRLS